MFEFQVCPYFWGWVPKFFSKHIQKGGCDSQCGQPHQIRCNSVLHLYQPEVFREVAGGGASDSSSDLPDTRARAPPGDPAYVPPGQSSITRKAPPAQQKARPNFNRENSIMSYAVFKMIRAVRIRACAAPAPKIRTLS